MRSWSPLLNAHYAARKGRNARLLMWIKARERGTFVEQTLGLWTGGDTVEFTIGGQTRVYYGAGTLPKIDPLTYTEGLTVRSQRIILSALPLEIRTHVLAYDLKLAPVEIHIAHFDPLSGLLLEEPTQEWSGVVDDLDLKVAEKQGSADLVVNLISEAYQLRKTSSLKRSAAALKARSPGDAFRDDIDQSGIVEAVWGEMRASGPPPPTPEPPEPEPDPNPGGPIVYPGR